MNQTSRNFQKNTLIDWAEALVESAQAQYGSSKKPEAQNFLMGAVVSKEQWRQILPMLDINAMPHHSLFQTGGRWWAICGSECVKDAIEAGRDVLRWRKDVCHNYHTHAWMKDRGVSWVLDQSNDVAGVITQGHISALKHVIRAGVDLNKPCVLFGQYNRPGQKEPAATLQVYPLPLAMLSQKTEATDALLTAGAGFIVDSKTDAPVVMVRFWKGLVKHAAGNKDLWLKKIFLKTHDLLLQQGFEEGEINKWRMGLTHEERQGLERIAQAQTPSDTQQKREQKKINKKDHPNTEAGTHGARELKDLQEHEKWDPDNINSNLILAVTQHKNEAAAALLRAGADPNTAWEEPVPSYYTMHNPMAKPTPYTIMSYAILRRNLKLVHTLLQHGVNWESEQPNNIPLAMDIARIVLNEAQTQTLARKDETWMSVLKKILGHKPDVTTNQGWNFLHYLAHMAGGSFSYAPNQSRVAWDLMSLADQLGCDANALDKNGKKPRDILQDKKSPFADFLKKIEARQSKKSIMDQILTQDENPISDAPSSKPKRM